jgi:hypothetical protein
LPAIPLAFSLPSPPLPISATATSFPLFK